MVLVFTACPPVPSVLPLDSLFACAGGGSASYLFLEDAIVVQVRGSGGLSASGSSRPKGRKHPRRVPSHSLHRRVTKKLRLASLCIDGASPVLATEVG